MIAVQHPSYLYLGTIYQRFLSYEYLISLATYQITLSMLPLVTKEFERALYHKLYVTVYSLSNTKLHSYIYIYIYIYIYTVKNEV